VNALLVALFLAATPVLPREATIIDSPTPGAPFARGNVLVTFSDGHREKWTRNGHALLPAVSTRGEVGWVRETTESGYRVLRTLRVCGPDGHHRDIVVDMPVIERWMFSPDGSTVILRFRGRHGPENFAEYDVATGKLLREADGQVNDDAPDWAVAIKSG
jgi:hypothetical protein